MRVEIKICAFLVGYTAAATTRDVKEQVIPITGKVCIDLTVSVNIKSENLIWAAPKFRDNYDVAALSAIVNQRIENGQNSIPPWDGSEIKSSKCNISGSWCQPRYGPPPTVVLIATHGLTLDRTYWDSPYQPENYSFVDAVISKGYSVFSYDRLGVGKSSRISGYVNQGSIQVAVLEELINIIRKGALQSAMKPFVIPKKVVLIGHSYGAILANALLSSKPGVVDGVIMTGWGYAYNFALTFATCQLRLANEFSRPGWETYDSGYLQVVDKYANANVFFKAPGFDPAAQELLYNTGTPLGIMENAAIAALNFSAPGYTGPVLFMLGEHDYIMCTGSCKGALDPRPNFPNANLHTYIIAGSGHNINFQHSAPTAYKVITNFLAASGL